MKEIEIHIKGGDGKRITTLPQVPDNTDYVDLTNEQTVEGKKNFTTTPTINNVNIATVNDIPEVATDNITITKDASNQLQSIALKDTVDNETITANTIRKAITIRRHS